MAHRWWTFFGGSQPLQPIAPGIEYRLVSSVIRIEATDRPVRLCLGREDEQKELVLVRDRSYEVEDSSHSYLLFDPALYARKVSGFLRLDPGGKLLLSSTDPVQRALFHYPESVTSRHFTIQHLGDSFVLTDHNHQDGTRVSVWESEGSGLAHLQQTLEKKAARLRELFGGPIRCLPPSEALTIIREVNAVMENEVARPKNRHGQPGGLVEFPASLVPVIIGDLHARVNNLLTILVENALLDGLENGCAGLVFVGDAAHSELENEMRNMDDSMLMMDLLFKLKLRFPGSFFFLRGDHEGFSPSLGKRGIPQGIIWADELKRSRGAAYLKEMQRYYDLLPLVARSQSFVVCHGAPASSGITPEMIVNISDHPEVYHELVWNRIKTLDHANGYSATSVKRFLKSLGPTKSVPFLVGHNPLSRDRAYWLDIHGIAGHHIVFSALTDRIGAFSIIDGQAIPLDLTPLPLRE